jgi:REP-associated tyrosine transposase
MAPLRVIDPTGIYHVGSNGNFDGSLYLEPRDRAAFLELYARVARRREWTTYAYCLMTTHFHFVVQLTDGGLSEGMRELNGCFSRRMNAVMGRTRRGHFFKNRFYANAVAEEAYLLGVCRYVVLNPVEAGICERPEQWGWSSYAASAGLCAAPTFLAVDELLAFFGSTTAQARAAYCAFVSEGHGAWSDQSNESVTPSSQITLATAAYAGARPA